MIEVYKSDVGLPTFKTLLAGKTVGAEVSRVPRTELSVQFGRTTFFDETLRPGRWTIDANGIKIDIMPRAMILNSTTEIRPQHEHR